VSRHLSVVRNLAYRLVLSNVAADDITQDVFVQVMRNAHKFRGESKFSTWLYQITMNMAKAYFRKQASSRELPADQISDLQNKESSPEQLTMHTELAKQIEQALTQLSEKLRAAIVLTSVECLSAKEAATIAGCSTATMHWRIHQARKQLKQLLHGYLKL